MKNQWCSQSLPVHNQNEGGNEENLSKDERNYIEMVQCSYPANPGLRAGYSPVKYKSRQSLTSSTWRRHNLYGIDRFGYMINMMYSIHT